VNVTVTQFSGFNLSANLDRELPLTRTDANNAKLLICYRALSIFRNDLICSIILAQNRLKIDMQVSRYGMAALISQFVLMQELKLGV
jgi:hypothetical protein